MPGTPDPATPARPGPSPPIPDAITVGPTVLHLGSGAGGEEARLFVENQNAVPAGSKQGSGAVLPWTATASAPWVKLSATSGQTPDEVRVTADPAGLAPGLHTATITLASPAAGAGGAPATVRVHLAVGQGGKDPPQRPPVLTRGTP